LTGAFFTFRAEKKKTKKKKKGKQKKKKKKKKNNNKKKNGNYFCDLSGGLIGAKARAALDRGKCATHLSPGAISLSWSRNPLDLNGSAED